MPRGSGQKEKLYRIIQILLDKTDENNAISVEEITRELNKYGISSERKSIYEDIETINDMNIGINVKKEKIGKANYYSVDERLFNISEIKLLVDCVQASKFLSENKSKELIKKIVTLTSVNNSKDIKSQVFVTGRVKSMNESIYGNVDNIHKAIHKGNQITFRYYRWNLQKQYEEKHKNKIYLVSPWAVLFDNENYYLVAIDEMNKIKHFRIDKMKDISILKESQSACKNLDYKHIPQYNKGHFSMYGGDIVNVRMQFANDAIGVAIDRFGRDVNIVRVDKEHFIIDVPIAVSGQFFGWVIGLGEQVKILSPQKVVDEMEIWLDSVEKMYKKRPEGLHLITHCESGITGDLS